MEHSKSAQLSSDELTLSVEHLPHCKVRFTVHAKPALIQTAKAMATKSVTKDVSIPGFRKGKAPLSMIEKKFPQAIKEKTLQELADLGFKKSQELAKIPFLTSQGQINYDLQSFSDETGANMTYEFESEPQVPTVDIHHLTLPEVIKEEVNDQKVDETIDYIRSFFSILDVVADRPAKEGDYVIVDIEDLDSGTPDKVFNKTRFEISERGMSDWMRELLTGMSTSEQKEGISRPNERDSDEIKAEYRPKKVRVTLHEIQNSKLPDIDENLAKKVGVETVEEMRSQLSKQLHKKHEMTHKEILREKICDALLETYPFDLPESLLKKEYDHRMHYLHNDENFQKNWKKMSFEEQEALKTKTHKEAENAIKIFYLCRKLMLDHKVKLALPEKGHDPMNMIDALFTQRGQTDYDQANEEQRAMILSRAMLTSAQDYVIENLLQNQKA
jgi:trigger factor